MAGIAIVVLGTITLLYHPLKLISFDPIVATAMGLPVLFFHYLLMGMISATVVAGLKTTGVILVVAMVITPASAAYQITNRFSNMLILAGFGPLRPSRNNFGICLERSFWTKHGLSCHIYIRSIVLFVPLMDTS